METLWGTDKTATKTAVSVISRRTLLKNSLRFFAGLYLLDQNLLSGSADPESLPKSLSPRSNFTIGSHWLNPERNLYGRPSCSVELIYSDQSLPGFDLAGTKNKVAQLMSKGNVDCYLRLDYQPGQTLPPTGNTSALNDYLKFTKRILHDDILGTISGIIFGNEPNNRNEWEVSNIPLTADWVARCIYGYGESDDLKNNAYQVVQSINPQMKVFVPAVGPFSIDVTGNRLYIPPNGRSALSPWELYMHELAFKSYFNKSTIPQNKISFAMHTYSRVGTDGTLNFGNMEPFSNHCESTYGAYFGTQSLDDMLYAINRANPTVTPPILISEWNCFTDAPPSQCYPKGLLNNVIKYVSNKLNLLGFANFVDQNLSGTWGDTAMTQEAKNSVRFQRLIDWSNDFDSLLKNGW